MIALVIGGSTAVKKEIKLAFEMVVPDMVVAVNDIGTTLTCRLDHWVTLHPIHWQRWLRERHEGNLPFDFQCWSPPFAEGVDKIPSTAPMHWLPDYKPSGLSGLYGIKVALYNGATKIILVGVPMDQSGHYSGNTRKHWINRRRHKSWEVRADELKDHVRSLSGWTRGRFGGPTPDWLSGSPSCPRRDVSAQQAGDVEPTSL